MMRPARKRPVLPQNKVNCRANAELLILREHRRRLFKALQSLFHLLEEYAPAWYSEKHRKLAAAALSSPKKFSAER
jgi:hypothetical protein